MKSTISYKPTDIRTVQLVELTDECIEKIVNKIKPVVRGEWILNNNQVYECKDCGYVPSFDGYTYYNFCPNCGADMRGEK